jgi:eukaryotic-like serine/threonine-protein kinase
VNASSHEMAEAFALLDEALELPARERAVWLANLPPERHALKPLLKELLAQHGELSGDTFLDSLPQFSTLGTLDEAMEMNIGGLAAGDLIGPYRLERELGVGGMGAVWLAERSDGVLKRTVALKLPHPGPFQKQLVERFQRERDILAALTHPHIARLYDAGASATGQPYLALEYVEGIPLNDYCARQHLDIDARLELFLQVLSAVQHAHNNLVLHRDLKPSNILVKADGDVQLLDFGIAKMMSGSEASETELTQLGGRALTPDYASPEQIQGGAINTASDVYSLGVILYELLTGVRPYKLKRGTRGELEEAILAADPIKPSAALRKLHESVDIAVVKQVRALQGDLDIICLKALKKDPAARYPTVAAFAAELERYRQHLPIETRRDSKLYAAQKFVQRHRTVVGLSALAFASLAVGMVMALMQAQRAASEAEVARAQSARAKASEQFLANLFKANSVDQADPQSAQRTTARELLDRGAARIDQELTNFPDAKADVLNTLAEMYVHVGDWDRAAALDRERLALIAKLNGRGSIQYAEALNLTAFRLNGTRRFDAEVLRYTAEAMEILRAAKRDSTMTYGALLRMQATALRSRDVTAAIESAHRAVETMRPLDDGTREFAKRYGQALADLGLRYAESGKLAEAQRALAEGHRVLANGIGADTFDTVYVEVCWGTVDALRGDVANAEQRLRKADMVRKLGGATQPASVFADGALGLLLANTGRVAEGLKLAEDAHNRVAATFGAEHPRTAEAAIVLGEILGYAGRAADAARMVERFIDDDLPYRPNAQVVLARALLQLEAPQVGRAQSLLESALSTIEGRQAIGSRWWVEGTLTRAQVRLAQGDSTTAGKDFEKVLAVALTGLGPQVRARAEAGLARVAAVAGEAAAARTHLARAEAAAADPLLLRAAARLQSELTRVRACVTEAETEKQVLRKAAPRVNPACAS